MPKLAPSCYVAIADRERVGGDAMLLCYWLGKGYFPTGAGGTDAK